MSEADLIYAWLRFGMAIEGTLMVGVLFVQSLRRVTRLQASDERRLRYATIMFALLGITILLALGAFIGDNLSFQPIRPPNSVPFRAILGVAIWAFIDIIATILVFTKAED